MHLEKATELLSLTDGADWIINVLRTSLAGLLAMLLDIFHRSEHLHAAAKHCLGDTPEARLRVQARLTELKTVGIRPLFKAIDDLARRMRSPKKKNQLRLLKDYVLKRFEMLDYRTAQARGMGHRIGADGGDVQNADLTAQAAGHEVGCRSRRGHDELAGDVRKQPTPTMVGDAGERRLMRKNMATPVFSTEFANRLQFG